MTSENRMSKKWILHEKQDWNEAKCDRYVLVVGCYVVSIKIDASRQEELYADLVLKVNGQERSLPSVLLAFKSDGEIKWNLSIDGCKEFAEKWLFDQANMDYVNAKLALKLLRPNQEIGDWGMTDVETHKDSSESRKES
jgi:hypothetical protein